MSGLRPRPPRWEYPRVGALFGVFLTIGVSRLLGFSTSEALAMLAVYWLMHIFFWLVYCHERNEL